MTQTSQTIRHDLARKLLTWYRKKRRALPWRETPDPYAIWISEVMLQQTQVDTVIPYYLRFLKTFPDVVSLARAPLPKVLKTWENLGYYSRARHLHAAARMIVSEFGGRLPDLVDDLRRLPGVGAYTAGAIASIAYGRAVAAVDGNVKRVLCRIFAVDTPLSNPQTLRHLDEIAQGLVPAKAPGDFNSALMDLGATVCRPKGPLCADCPLAKLCLARQNARENALPVVIRRVKTPHRYAAAAVLLDGQGRLLMTQRPPAGLLASFWKLPGGIPTAKAPSSKDMADDVRKELGIEVEVGKKIASVDHVYTHFRLTLAAFTARRISGRPQALGCQAFAWVKSADLAQLPLSKIDRLILAAATGLAKKKGR